MRIQLTMGFLQARGFEFSVGIRAAMDEPACRGALVLLPSENAFTCCTQIDDLCHLKAQACLAGLPILPALPSALRWK